MTEKKQMEEFARGLTKAAKNHDEWLVIVRFGLAELLEEQGFLFELVWHEAVRENTRRDRPAAEVSIVAHQIFNELRLKIVSRDRDDD
jgi:hypothetical protein